MTSDKPVSLTPASVRYPARLRERLGANAPDELFALGNLDLLALPKTALFCSARCVQRTHFLSSSGRGFLQ